MLGLELKRIILHSMEIRIKKTGLLLCFLVSFNAFAQKEILVLDTIKIDDLIFVGFKENGYINSLLISEKLLDSLKEKDISYQDFCLNHNTFKIYSPCEFYKTLQFTEEGKKDKKIKRIVNLMAEVCDKDNETFLNRELEPNKIGKYTFKKMHTNKFLFVLVKYSVLRKREGEDVLGLKGCDNIYMRVLLPLKE